jgi:hypothetical protein
LPSSFQSGNEGMGMALGPNFFLKERCVKDRVDPCFLSFLPYAFCDQKRPNELLVEIVCFHASGHRLVSFYGLGGAWKIGQQSWSGAAIYNFPVGRVAKCQPLL